MPAVFLPLALVLSTLALLWPEGFVWARPHIGPLLGLIMLGMGLTLTLQDFRGVIQRWRLVTLGVVMQYTVMPLAALGIGLLLRLPSELIIGLIIVGSCPGGTASNVITYLARGNVALSVSLTLVSSFLAPLLTPALILWLAGERIELGYGTLMGAVAQVVLIPLVLGITLRTVLGEQRLQPALKILPWLSMVIIAFIIAIVFGLSRATILALPWLVFLAVVLHNTVGLSAGYGLASLFTQDRADRRTLAIEVGMQNSGLGANLATLFFTGATALPSALFSLWHNVSGVILASWWAKKPQP